MQNRILPISNDRTEITRVVNHLYEAIESVKSSQAPAVDTRQPSPSTGGGSVVVGPSGISSVGGASANGFQATVTNPTTAPVVSVGTTLSAGMVKSDGAGGIGLAVAGTDFVVPSGTVAHVTGFSPTTGKTLSVSNSLTLAGTDGSTLNVGTGGTLGTGAFASAYSLPTATSSVLGGVKPDGTSILNSSGILSATAASVGALASGGTAVDSSKLGGQIPAAYARVDGSTPFTANTFVQGTDVRFGVRGGGSVNGVVLEMEGSKNAYLNNYENTLFNFMNNNTLFMQVSGISCTFSGNLLLNAGQGAYALQFQNGGATQWRNYLTTGNALTWENGGALTALTLYQDGSAYLGSVRCVNLKTNALWLDYAATTTGSLTAAKRVLVTVGSETLYLLAAT